MTSQLGFTDELFNPPLGPNEFYVETMGTLGTLLGAQKVTISEMKLTGQINRADFDVMKNEMPNLTYIDLKDVTCDGNTIPFRALNGKSKIKTIILPTSITSIGVEAFDGCSGLTGSLTLPDGLVAINGAAFANCSGLTGTLVLPAELITIGNFAFLCLLKEYYLYKSYPYLLEKVQISY